MASRSVFYVLLILFHLASAIVRQPAIDEEIVKQMERIAKGESNNLKGNKVDKKLVAEIFYERHMTGLATRTFPRERKEYRCMLPSERSNLHSALKTLKTTKAVGANLTQYDAFIAQHDRSNSPGAHGGPAFLPFHRQYLYALELLAQNVCPSCALPYWDSRLDGRLGGNPRDSILFSPLLAGNAVGPVVTGFAANWSSPGPVCASIHPTLRRNVITDVFSYFDDNDVKFVENVYSHRELSFPWVDTFEMSHGYVHTSFGSGSHMSSILCSPCDPMFLMHHAFVDNLYERGRTSIKKNGINGLEYVDVNNLPPGFRDFGSIVRVHSAPNATMQPFKGINNSYGLLSDDYINFWYKYEISPGDVECTNDADCCANGNAEFIWCDTIGRRCLSKVSEGGKVKAVFPPRACYCPPGRQPYIKATLTCGCK